MSSNFGQAPRITSILLITSGLVGIAIPAHSAEQDIDHFTLTVYSNTCGTQELLTGHYDEALARLEASRVDDARLFESTNLCVAQIMTGHFDSARTTCDVAVKNARSSVAIPYWGARADANQVDVAIAYANRAVLHWLTDDTQSAASDLAQAKRFAPKAEFVARGLIALNAQDQTAGTFRLAK